MYLTLLCFTHIHLTVIFCTHLHFSLICYTSQYSAKLTHTISSSSKLVTSPILLNIVYSLQQDSFFMFLPVPVPVLVFPLLSYKNCVVTCPEVTAGVRRNMRNLAKTKKIVEEMQTHCKNYVCSSLRKIHTVI